MTTKTTKQQAKPAPAKAEDEVKPRSGKVRATDVLDEVFQAIQAAGPEGISLKVLEEQTGLRYRVLHNVVWHLMEKAEPARIKRVGEGRKLVFASVEAKPAPKPRAPRKPATRKAPAKASKAA